MSVICQYFIAGLFGRWVQGMVCLWICAVFRFSESHSPSASSFLSPQDAQAFRDRTGHIPTHVALQQVTHHNAEQEKGPHQHTSSLSHSSVRNSIHLTRSDKNGGEVAEMPLGPVPPKTRTSTLLPRDVYHSPSSYCFDEIGLEACSKLLHQGNDTAASRAGARFAHWLPSKIPSITATKTFANLISRSAVAPALSDRHTAREPGAVSSARKLLNEVPDALRSASHSSNSEHEREKASPLLEGCTDQEKLSCAFSCGVCSNTPLCAGPAAEEKEEEEEEEAIPLDVQEDDAHRAARVSEPTQPSPKKGGKRIALCVTGATEDRRVDAYCLLSTTRCLLPSLGRRRTDLFIMGSPRFSHPEVERLAVAVARRADPTMYEITNVLRQLSDEVHATWEAHGLPKSWTKSKGGVPNMRGHSLGRLWLQHVRMKRCLQSIEAYEAEAGVSYDFIVRTRMDAKWFAPLPASAVEQLLQAEATDPVVITPAEHAWGGINDRFVMTTRAGFLAYSNLFQNLMKKDRSGPFAVGWSKNVTGCDGMCNGEKLLKYHIQAVMPTARMGTLEAPFCLLSVPKTEPQDSYQPVCIAMAGPGRMEGFEALRALRVVPLCVCAPEEALANEESLVTKFVDSGLKEDGEHEMERLAHQEAIDSWHHLVNSVEHISEATGEMCTWATKSKCSLFDARI